MSNRLSSLGHPPTGFVVQRMAKSGVDVGWRGSRPAVWSSEGYRIVLLEGLEQSKRDGKHDRAKCDAEQSKHTDSAKDGKENEKFV